MNAKTKTPRIPRDFPVRPLRAGQPAKDRATCGTCGRSWDDSIATTYTPAPSGRCPFEYFHAEPERMVRVLRIDAWREAEGGWTWNSWRKVGTVPESLCDASPRMLFRALRDAGFLSAESAGRVARDDDGYNIVVTDKNSAEPLLALEYGARGDA